MKRQTDRQQAGRQAGVARDESRIPHRSLRQPPRKGCQPMILANNSKKKHEIEEILGRREGASRGQIYIDNFGRASPSPSSRPYFYFYAVFRKIWPNNRLPPALVLDPGSAAGHRERLIFRSFFRQEMNFFQNVHSV